MVAVLDRNSDGRTPFWPSLVERVLAHFGERPPRPRRESLRRMLEEDRVFDEDYRDRMARLTRRRSWRKSPCLNRSVFPALEPRFEAGPRAEGWDLPEISTHRELASRLGVPTTTLEGWADARGWLGRIRSDSRQHYRRTWVPGRSGGRLLEAPKEQLKKMQSWILRAILNRIPLHDAAHGFVRGRSIRSHAERHVGQRVVLRVDLRAFFSSISAGRVHGLFAYGGYPEDVADTLTGLSTTITPADALPPSTDPFLADLLRQRHLPQGAPTSPALANLVAFRMDARLAGFAEAWGAHYSRYADDLTFSGGGALRGGRFLGGVTDIVEAEGFTVRTNKTLCMGQGRRQTVTGLVVNEQVALPRRRFDRLKAILHQCALDGPDAHNREQHPDFRAHLLGQISFAEMVDPARGAKLRARFERISWD